MARTRAADTSGLDRKPIAGLSAIMSVKSRSGYAEIRMTCGEWSSPVRKLPREVEAALVAKIDVDQAHVRLQSPNEPRGLADRRCDADHLESLALEQLTRGREEARVVIDQEGSRRHAR